MADSNGYNLVKGWQLALSIILILVGIGVTYGVASSSVADLSVRVTKIEAWRDGHTEAEHQARITLEKKLTEIQINQKVMMDKLGLKYQTVE